MSTTLNNQALVSYYYNGEQSGGSAASNMISTTLLDQYSISAVKTALDAHKWEFCELYLERGRLDEVFRSLTTSDAVEGKEGAA